MRVDNAMGIRAESASYDPRRDKTTFFRYNNDHGFYVCIGERDGRWEKSANASKSEKEPESVCADYNRIGSTDAYIG